MINILNTEYALYRYNYTTMARQPKQRTMYVTDSQNTAQNSDRDQTDSDDLVVDVSCDSEDARGHYIFIRDDRKKVDYFTICEVEVFEFDKKGTQIYTPLRTLSLH